MPRLGKSRVAMASALAADLCAASIATAQLYGMACNLQGTIMLLLYQQGYTKVISHMCCTPPSTQGLRNFI